MTCSSRVSPPCAPRGPAEVVDVQLQHCIAESHGQGEHLLTNVHSADELALLETHFLGRSCSVSRLVSRPPSSPWPSIPLLYVISSLAIVVTASVFLPSFLQFRCSAYLFWRIIFVLFFALISKKITHAFI